MYRLRYAILWSGFLLFPMAASSAEEVSLFRLTDFNGYLELNYKDDQTNNESSGAKTSIEDTRRQLELGISSTSYVFHPKFLHMQISGSLLSDEQLLLRDVTGPQVSGLSTQIDQKLTNVNLDTQFYLLKDKPYPLTIRYSRENPTVNTGVEGSFTQTTNRFGLDLQVREILPLELQVKTDQSSSYGASLDRIVDTEMSRFAVKAKKDYSEGDRVSFGWEESVHVSRNGNPNRTIRTVNSRAQRITLASQTKFGDENQITLEQNANLSRRRNPDVSDLFFAPRVRWTHGKAVQSNYRYRLTRSRRARVGLENTSHSLLASAVYRPSDAFNGTLDVSFEDSDESGRLSRSARGISGQATVKRALPIGDLGMEVGLGVRLDDRVSFSPRVLVKEEEVILGIAPSSLASEFIVLESVIVSNDTGTQTYIKDIDYRLSQLGSTTRIERLVGGSILEDEAVLVDYEAETGGTFAFSETSQSIGFNLRFRQYHDVFLRYNRSRPSLKSGFSTLPFNAVSAIEVGLRQKIPLRWAGIQLSTEARYRHQDEDINPYNQLNLMMAMQAPVLPRMQVNLSASRNRVDNLLSDEDSDAIRFNAGLSWEIMRNLFLRAQGSMDEDTGGSIARSSSRWQTSAQWQYRKISVGMEMKYFEQKQGDLAKDQYQMLFHFRRNLR